MTSTTQQQQASRESDLFAHPLAWVMWGLGALFYFYVYLLQVSPSVMIGELMQSFDITAVHMGYFAAIYFFTYAPLQIVVGILLDKYGPHRLLTAACGACVVGSVLFASTSHFAVAMIGRALIGFGSAFSIVGCMKIISNWFPEKHFALMFGLVLSIGMLGAIAGLTPLKLMLEYVGSWRYCLYSLAIAGAVIMLLMQFVLRDKPTPTTGPSNEATDPGMSTALRLILSNPQSWLVSLYGGLMFAPTTVLGSFLGVKFIACAYHMNDIQASSMTGLLFIGWAVGSPLAGWCSDKIGRRLPTMYLSTCLSATLLSAVLYLPLSNLLLGLALFGFGFASSGFLSAFALIKEINPRQYDATTLGFMNTVNMLGGAFLAPVTGFLLDFYWSGKKISGAPLYVPEDYQAALTILPITMLLAGVVLPFIKETYCQSNGGTPSNLTITDPITDPVTG
jgi:MFS family permease